MPKFNLIKLITVSAIFALVGCTGRLAPIENIDNASYGTSAFEQSKTLSLDDYGRAVVRGAALRNWVSKSVGPGHIEATNVVRGKHTVVVDILYNAETFSITHKSSQNMNWVPATSMIHQNFNAWVGLLESDIRSEVQRLRAF